MLDRHITPEQSNCLCRAEVAIFPASVAVASQAHILVSLVSHRWQVTHSPINSMGIKGRNAVRPPLAASFGRGLEARRLHQIRSRAFQCRRDLDDIQQRDVALASFDPSHVRAIDPGGVCKRLLREVEVKAALTNGLAELRQVPPVILLR